MQMMNLPTAPSQLYHMGAHLCFFAATPQHETHIQVLADLLGKDFRIFPELPSPFLQALLTELAAAPARPGQGWRIRPHDLHVEPLVLQPAPAACKPFDLLTPQLEHQPLSCRTREIPARLLETLFQTERWPVQGMPVYAVPVRLLGQLDHGIGRAFKAPQARMGAILEALERRSAVLDSAAADRFSITTARFKDLKQTDRCLDPGTLVPLDGVAETATAQMDWVKGWSMKHQEPIFVPVRHVFMGYSRDAEELNVSSSGCALGSSLEEALLHALFELIERDGFLLSWFSQSPVPQLDLFQIRDQGVLDSIEAIKHLGHQVEIYDTTQESQLPSVWVKTTGEPGKIHAFSSLGAHMDPIRAIQGALTEVLVSLELYPPHFDPVRAEHLLRHPAEVQSGMDHFQFYAHPESQRHLDFLPTKTDPQATARFLQLQNLWQDQDITQKLRQLVSRLLEVHPDVVFVDLTSPGLRALGLHAVRAVVPDLLPMTWGQQSRTLGCQRLLKKRPTGPFSEIPHPFP